VPVAAVGLPATAAVAAATPNWIGGFSIPPPPAMAGLLDPATARRQQQQQKI